MIYNQFYSLHNLHRIVNVIVGTLGIVEYL